MRSRWRGAGSEGGPQMSALQQCLLLKAGCVFWVCDEPLALSVFPSLEQWKSLSPQLCFTQRRSDFRAGLEVPLQECLRLSLRAHGFQSDPTPSRGLLLRTFLPDGGLVNLFRSLWSLTAQTPASSPSDLLSWHGLAACLLNTSVMESGNRPRKATEFSFHIKEKPFEEIESPSESEDPGEQEAKCLFLIMTGN